MKEMIDKMKADHAIDDEGVFVTGLSGGGAMTALMLAVWPDVFSGGAIFAGIPYGCATNKKTTAETGECLESYTGADAYLSRTPARWGDLVRTAAPSFKGPYPRVSIWHGTASIRLPTPTTASMASRTPRTRTRRARRSSRRTRSPDRATAPRSRLPRPSIRRSPAERNAARPAHTS